MRIIPVIDVMGGVVVRAVAGRRSEYRPLVSRLTQSTDPLVVAEALLQATGAKELYVADLDAILGEATSALEPSMFAATVLFDAGLRTLDQLDDMKRSPDVRAVVGTETWTVPPAQWPQPIPAILSLDYYEGELRTGWPRSDSELGLMDKVAAVIVLDIARIGTGRGTGTEEIIRRLRHTHPHFEIIAGGGVKDRDDLRRLADAGADAALVASALHDGSIFGVE